MLLIVLADRHAGRDAWIARRISNRLFECFPILEQDRQPVRPVLLRCLTPFARQLVGEPIQAASELQRHGRREDNVMLHPRKAENGHCSNPPPHLGPRLSERAIEQLVEHLRRRWNAGVCSMLTLEPVQALGCEQCIDRLDRTDLRRLERIEYRPARGRDDLDIRLPIVVAAEAARQNRGKFGRHGQLSGRYRIQERIERCPLGRPRD